jgi:hypothetical protein
MMRVSEKVWMKGFAWRVKSVYPKGVILEPEENDVKVVEVSPWAI